MRVFDAPAFWFILLLTAAWWPSRFTGPLDGAPLDRRLEAILLGLVMPWLFWLGRSVCRSRSFRLLVSVLLLWKIGTSFVAVQHGLCATVRAPQPIHGPAFDIRVDEPNGYLRSWDVRADVWKAEPECTAILTRPLHSTHEFPAWFVNITDQTLQRRDFTMTVRGVVTRADGRTHIAEYTQPLGAGEWWFDPQLDETSVFASGLVTTRMPSAFDRVVGSWAWLVAAALCVVIAGSLLRVAIQPLLGNVTAFVWVFVAVAISIAIALSPLEAWHRAAGVIGAGALLVPLQPVTDSARMAVWLIGAPWLAFFATWAAGLVGRFSAYSMDDWLAYQIAGYRIFINGFWLEAGTLTFDYQPFYRWITGALHLVFGDSSVGEVYWDASCLMVGALLAFRLTEARAGARWGVAAAAATLTTFTVSTPWYLVGRGLPEISAAAFAFATIFCLWHAQRAGLGAVLIAVVTAALTFYTRLNHLLWAPSLAAMLLPYGVGSDWRSVWSAIRRLSWQPVAVYWAGFALAVVAFMTRTWYFTGSFSLFHGTALRHNDTGLRPWHIVDAEVWSKIGHSVAGFMFMNEPPRFDLRSIVLVAGVLVGMLASLQFPISRRVPAALLLVAAGSAVGVFLAHSHGYPGRFTVHAIPLASALTAIAANTMTIGFTGSDWRASQSSGT